MNRTPVGCMNGNSHASRYVRECQELSRWNMEQELTKALEAVRPFFTAKAWYAWVDAAPLRLADFLAYARHEYRCIVAELFEDEQPAPLGQG